LVRDSLKRERSISESRRKGRPISWEDKFRARVAKAKLDSAKNDGVVYGNMHEKEIDGLSLEHQFFAVSKKAVKKDFFHGEATLFNHHFSPSQPKLLGK
jgi:hypothetical protein